MRETETYSFDVLPWPTGREPRDGRVHDSRAQRCALFGAVPACGEPARTISLEEHVRIAHECAQHLCVCGTIEVELCRSFTARGVHVEEGQ